MAATLVEVLIPWQVEQNPAVLQFRDAMKVPEPTGGAEKMNLSCLETLWYTWGLTWISWDEFITMHAFCARTRNVMEQYKAFGTVWLYHPDEKKTRDVESSAEGVSENRTHPHDGKLNARPLVLGYKPIQAFGAGQDLPISRMHCASTYIRKSQQFWAEQKDA